MDINDMVQEEEFKELLKELLDGGYIDHEVSVGITKHIIDKGLGSLTGDQVKVYEKYRSNS